MTPRRASAGDLPAVGEIARAAYAGYVPLIGREPAPMVADFAAHLARGELFVVDDPPAGLIVLYPEDGSMFVENVAVSPAAQGRGVGGALLAFAEDEARRLGLRRMALYTNAKMEANLALYPRLGYRETGRRTEDGFDRVYFEKMLEGMP